MPVKESKIKLGLSLQQQIPITVNDTTLMIGRIEYLLCPEELIQDNGYIDLDLINNVGIGGLNRYYSLDLMAEFPYARRKNVPDFQKDEEK